MSGASATPRGKRVRLRFGDHLLYGDDDLMFLTYVLDADNGRFLVLTCLDGANVGTLWDVGRPELLEAGYEPR